MKNTAAHILLQTRRSGKKPTAWQRAWGGSAMTITSYAAAWFIAIGVLVDSGHDPHPLLALGLTYLLPLLIGLSLRIPTVYQQVKALSWGIITRSLLAEIIMLNLGYAFFFPLTVLVSDRLLGTTPHPTSPYFWAMVSFIAVVGVIVSVPLQWWMVRRGRRLAAGSEADATRRVSLPGLRASWPALLTTSAILVAALAVTIGQMG